MQLPFSKDQPAHPAFSGALQEVQHCAAPPKLTVCQPEGTPTQPPGMTSPTSRTLLCVVHEDWRQWLRKFQTCVEFGRRPVEKEARDGEHTDSCAYARSKRRPVAARLSRCGVCMPATPYAPSSGRRSSKTM